MLLSPIWLFAIAAISIPVIIHLWNIRPGKTLKVGSIALMGASSRKNSRSFNFLDVLLLVLRCLFLLIVALLLAQPYWSQKLRPEKTKGWVLIPKQNIHLVYSTFTSKVDSLTKAGYQLRYFAPGFEMATDTLYKKKIDSNVTAPIKTWVLLKELSKQAPAQLPVYVFVPNTLNSLGGEKPNLPLNLQIQTYSIADSTAEWLQSARYTSTGDGIQITGGSSKSGGTVFTSAIVQATKQRNSPYQVNINNGRPSVSLKNAKPGAIDQQVLVDTTTLRISIFSNHYITDANYLSAALTAVKQFTNRKIQISKVTDAVEIPSRQNWLFWLSDSPVPQSVKAQTAHLLIYEPGEVQNVYSTLNVTGSEPITLSKRIPAQTGEDKVLWYDGFGNNVLSRTNEGNIIVYSFYTHFDPAWNDLVWNDAFPQMMLNLVLSEEGNLFDTNSTDRRVADDQQLLPDIITNKTHLSESIAMNKTDLSKGFWLALVLVFLIERIIAHRTKNTETYG